MAEPAAPKMAEEDLLRMTADVVAAYVSNNTLATAQLADVTAQGGAVDPEVLGRILALAAQVDLHGAAAHRPADDFLELGFQQVVGFGGADGDFQVTVIQRSQFDRHR